MARIKRIIPGKESQLAAKLLIILSGIFEWHDRVKAAGGCTSIEGVAVAHAMMNSLEKNREKIDQIIDSHIEEEADA